MKRYTPPQSGGTGPKRSKPDVPEPEEIIHLPVLPTSRDRSHVIPQPPPPPPPPYHQVDGDFGTEIRELLRHFTHSIHTYGNDVSEGFIIDYSQEDQTLEQEEPKPSTIWLPD